MRPVQLLVGATAAATALLVAAPALAGDPVGPSAETIAENLNGPVQVQAFEGGALVSQSEPGRVTAIFDGGEQFDLVQDRGFVSGVAYNGSTIAYTLVAGSEDDPVTRLKVLNLGPARALSNDARARGELGGQRGENLANLGRFENRVNPDGDQRYGIPGVKKCDGVPPRFRPYAGTPFSNPHAVAAAREGGWFVADAGANSLLHVADDGAVEVVAVLPPQRLRITQAVADDLELPGCTVGKVAKFEPVPTDVEESASGRLFVTLLPGGPGPMESRGKLVRINRDTGKATTITRRLVGATNLALAPGRIFVNQLFGGKISEVDRSTGAKRLYIRQSLPVASDYAGGALYATTDIFGPGKLVKITEGGQVS